MKQLKKILLMVFMREISMLLTVMEEQLNLFLNMTLIVMDTSIFSLQDTMGIMSISIGEMLMVIVLIGVEPFQFLEVAIVTPLT